MLRVIVPIHAIIWVAIIIYLWSQWSVANPWLKYTLCVVAVLVPPELDLFKIYKESYSEYRQRVEKEKANVN